MCLECLWITLLWTERTPHFSRFQISTNIFTSGTVRIRQSNWTLTGPACCKTYSYVVYIRYLKVEYIGPQKNPWRNLALYRQIWWVHRGFISISQTSFYELLFKWSKSRGGVDVAYAIVAIVGSSANLTRVIDDVYDYIEPPNAPRNVAT